MGQVQSAWDVSLKVFEAPTEKEIAVQSARCKRLMQSFGTWNVIVLYLLPQESHKLQLCNQFFYQIAVSRSLPKFSIYKVALTRYSRCDFDLVMANMHSKFWT